MSRPRALVTGATGFLGRRLVPRLLTAGLDVRALVRRTDDGEALRQSLPPADRDRLEIALGSYTRADTMKSAAAGCELVYHVAAAMSGSPAGFVQTTVTGTRTMLEALRETGLRRLVLVSSLAVYDTSPLKRGDTLEESCPLEPKPAERDPYCYSKVLQERVAWEAHEQAGLPLVVVRPGVLYGPVRGCLSTRVGLRFGNFVLRVGGWHHLPYSYVDNCADAVAAAGTAPGIEGQAINVIDDELPTGRRLIREYRRHVGPLYAIWIPLWTLDPLSRSCEWYHTWSEGQLPAVFTRYSSAALWTPLVYSNAKAKRALGWRPAVGLDEALRRTLAV